MTEKRELSRPKRIGRPSLGVAARVILPLRVDPATAAAIRADRRAGEGVGQVVDRWASER